MQASYPIFLDVTDRLVVIVGGGAVAARKAHGLIDAGAKHIRVIAPDFRAEFPSPAQKMNEAYRPEHLEGASLVFAATDRADVNASIVRDANARGVLVNRADGDDESPGDFVTPARLVRGPITVAISAGSPALAALIKNTLSENWDPRWTKLADAMQTLRPEILRNHPPIVRPAIFRDLASEEALAVVDSGGIQAVRVWLAGRTPDISG